VHALEVDHPALLGPHRVVLDDGERRAQVAIGVRVQHELNALPHSYIVDIIV
jgi:hypothetical protein